MAIWIIFSLMTCAAVIAILWPLSRPEPALQQADEADVTFYKEQVAEIKRDLSRGLMSSEEAEAAKAEAGRRLLRSARDGADDTSSQFSSRPALHRRRIIAILAMVLIPVMGLGGYWVHGAPDYQIRSDEVFQQQQRQQAMRGEQARILAAVQQMEQHLKDNPQDGQGWDVLAAVYLRMERSREAAEAYGKALALLGEDAARLTGYGQALFYADDAKMSDKAKAAFEKSAALDPNASIPRFFLGYAAEQSGDKEKAKQYYQDVLKVSPGLNEARDRLIALGGQAPAGESSQQQVDQETINAMVESLATRLDQNGGTAEEWVKLVRSYTVIGDKSKAVATIAKAREALASDKEGLAAFESGMRGLKLDKGGEK